MLFFRIIDDDLLTPDDAHYLFIIIINYCNIPIVFAIMILRDDDDDDDSNYCYSIIEKLMILIWKWY